MNNISDIHNIMDLLDNHNIHIPEIQRDYAYGRLSEKPHVEKFLQAIFAVLKGKEPSLRLNYIYGVPKEIDGKPAVILIDGQQRTTTLYLIRLFLAVNAGEIQEDNTFANNLTYATRTTSTEFCKFLREHSDVLKKDAASVEERIDNHKSFLKKWRNDPTVSSMLAVLKMIDQNCGQEDADTFKTYLANLNNIRFDFILLEGFRREEALYTAMNGRGKQLTTFERLKGHILTLLEGHATNIDDLINNQWIPNFWDYAYSQATAKAGKDPDVYAANEHDKYLYTYFEYVLTMVHFAHKDVKKEDDSATVETILEWLMAEDVDTTTQEYACQLILFAMENFPVWRKENFRDWLATANQHDKIDAPDKTNLFGSKELNLIDNCFSNKGWSDLCMLWAFIVYRYQEQNHSTSGSLQDYFVLMRDLYNASRDSQTPTSLGKQPAEHLVAKAVKAFHRIVTGNATETNFPYRIQRDTFAIENPAKYQILNNYASRGCSNNIADVIHFNGVSPTEAQQFADNLDFLFENVGPENQKALEDIGYPYFVATNHKKNRLYVPYTKEMLQSMFSLGQWVDHRYHCFIKALCTNRLTRSSKVYTEQDWQWYLQHADYRKYFVSEKTLSAFDVTVDLTSEAPKFFEMESVHGERATSNQIASPFILAAFAQKRGFAMHKGTVAECRKYVQNHGVTIRESASDLVITIDQTPHTIPLATGTDVIQEIVKWIN